MAFRRPAHSVGSHRMSPSSSVPLISRLLWCLWHKAAEYKAQFQNTTLFRLSAGLRHFSGTKRSSAGIKVSRVPPLVPHVAVSYPPVCFSPDKKQRTTSVSLIGQLSIGASSRMSVYGQDRRPNETATRWRVPSDFLRYSRVPVCRSDMQQRVGIFRSDARRNRGSGMDFGASSSLGPTIPWVVGRRSHGGSCLRLRRCRYSGSGLLSVREPRVQRLGALRSQRRFRQGVTAGKSGRERVRLRPGGTGTLCVGYCRPPSH